MVFTAVTEVGTTSLSPNPDSLLFQEVLAEHIPNNISFALSGFEQQQQKNEQSWG